MIRKEEEKTRKRGQNTYNVQKYHFFTFEKRSGINWLIMTLGYHYSTTSEVDRDLETKIKKMGLDDF